MKATFIEAEENLKRRKEGRMPASRRRSSFLADATTHLEQQKKRLRAGSISEIASTLLPPSAELLTVSAPGMGDEPGEERDRNLSLWERTSWLTKIYSVSEPGSFPSDIPRRTQTIAYATTGFMALAIFLSCLSVMGESYPIYQTQHLPTYWVLIEGICVIIFTVDIVVRFVSCPNKFRFLRDIMNYVDVLAILPFYVSQGGSDFASWLRILRAIRLVRLVRVLKTSNILGLKAVLVALQESVSGLILFIGVSGVALLIFATCIYFAERGEFDAANGLWERPCLRNDPICGLNANGTLGKEPSPFQSIPDAFWYTIVTMGTVGFGDQVPTTGVGQFVGVFVMLSGVFVIAFPTMILSGHYDASSADQAQFRTTFKELHEQNRDKLLSGKQPFDPIKTIEGRRYGNPSVPLPKHLASLEKELIESRKADVVGLFSYGFRVRDLWRKRGLSPEYFYDPLIKLLHGPDGIPEIRAIFGKAGQPTLIQFTVMLDNNDARMAASKIARTLEPEAIVNVDLGGGLTISHHSPAVTYLKDREITSRYKMLPCFMPGGYHSSMLPIYFQRERSSELPDYVKQEEDEYLSEERIREEALSYLLGTSLFVKHHIENAVVRKRITVVAQFFMHTRLHMELDMLARKMTESLERGEDAMTYAAENDIIALLPNVHAKVDLYDETLQLKHPELVDKAITDTMLRRMRQIAIVQIPAKFKNCVFNAEVLSDDDIVYEIPVSFFEADLADEVEVDSLGYIEVTARRTCSHCSRLDIGVSTIAGEGRPPTPEEDFHDHFDECAFY